MQDTVGEARTNSCALLLGISVHRRASVGQPRRTYIQESRMGIGYCLKDLEAMDDRDEWDERFMLAAGLIIYIYIYMYTHTHTHTHIYIYIYIYIIIIMIAASMDIPDPPSTFLPIIHHLWQVFWVTSCILT